MLDEIIEDFCSRSDLKKNDEHYIVTDDTQVGIEFCFEKMTDGRRLVREEAIRHLYDNYPEAYEAFYDLI